MQRTYRFALSLVLAVGFALPVAAQSEQSWSFENVDRIQLEGVSGELEVIAGSGNAITVRLEHDGSSSDAFRGDVEQDGSTVRITEDWGRSGRRGGRGWGRSSGSVRWILTVPTTLQPTIDMESASGGVDVSGVTARFDVDTASGDFEIRNGTLLAGSDISTASGDLSIVDSTVEDGVDMSTASGDVDVEASKLDGVGDFSSASGDVTVRLSGALTDDFEASSASGNVDFRADFGDNFTLVMTVREDRGRIDSPFPITDEETFERHGRTYVRKTVQRGSGGPEIYLGSASGRVTVREGS